MLHEATDRIMAAITALVEDLRGEKAPAAALRPQGLGRRRDRQPPQAEGVAVVSRVAVFGAGSWGTAFSIVLADAGNDVTIWGRRPEVCDQINATHENADYFPGIELPPAVSATPDPAKAADGAEFIVFTMPSQTFRTNVSEWARSCPTTRCSSR